jgi:hypothetical protein
VVGFLASDPLIREKGLDVPTCKRALEDLGFDESRLSLTISTLSGVPLRHAVCVPILSPLHVTATCNMPMPMPLLFSAHLALEDGRCEGMESLVWFLVSVR